MPARLNDDRLGSKLPGARSQADLTRLGPGLHNTDVLGELFGLAVCELCYHGASDQQIAACEMVPDPDNLEEKLIAQAEKQTGKHGNSIVAFCLVE